MSTLKADKDTEVKTLLIRAQNAEKENKLTDKSEKSSDKAQIRQLTSNNKKLNVSLTIIHSEFS